MMLWLFYCDEGMNMLLLFLVPSNVKNCGLENQ